MTRVAGIKYLTALEPKRDYVSLTIVVGAPSLGIDTVNIVIVDFPVHTCLSVQESV
jgi:hypothetical protein